jgi:colicin import membrane protein
MENALIVVEKIDPVAVFTNGGVGPVLEEIRAKATNFEADVSTEKGRKEVASMAYKVARSKTLLDDLGKSLVADWKAKVKKVDSSRKEIRDTLDALKDEVRQPLTKYEEEQERIRQEKIAVEEARVAKIRGEIEHIEAMADIPPGTPSAKIGEVVAAMEEASVNEDTFMEFTDKATSTKEKALESLRAAFADMQAWEAKQAKAKEEAERLEKERAEQEAAAAKLKAEQEAFEAERRKLQEEKDRIERERKAEEDRKAREEFERKAKEEARAQAEKEAKERAEREAWEAKARAEREARKKEERERKEAEEKAREAQLRPDREKLNSYAQSLLEIVEPELKDEAALDLLAWGRGQLEALVNEIIEKSEAL